VEIKTGGEAPVVGQQTRRRTTEPDDTCVGNLASCGKWEQLGQQNKNSRKSEVFDAETGPRAGEARSAEHEACTRTYCWRNHSSRAVVTAKTKLEPQRATARPGTPGSGGWKRQGSNGEWGRATTGAFRTKTRRTKEQWAAHICSSSSNARNGTEAGTEEQKRKSAVARTEPGHGWWEPKTGAKKWRRDEQNGKLENKSEAGPTAEEEIEQRQKELRCRHQIKMVRNE
jgi:hypothetical protein